MPRPKGHHSSSNSPADASEFSLDRFGPIVGGTELERLLGFTSSPAFRQAYHRGRLPVKVFTLPERRGKFAFTADIAAWLASVRAGLDDQEAAPDEPGDGTKEAKNNGVASATDQREGMP